MGKRGQENVAPRQYVGFLFSPLRDTTLVGPCDTLFEQDEALHGTIHDSQPLKVEIVDNKQDVEADMSCGGRSCVRCARASADASTSKVEVCAQLHRLSFSRRTERFTRAQQAAPYSSTSVPLANLSDLDAN